VFWEPCAQKQKPKNSQQLGKTDSMRTKKPFSKDLKTQLLGEQNMQQHLLAIKSTKQTGLVFEFFQPHHLWQLMEPPRNIHQWAKGHSSFLRKITINNN